MSHIYYVLGVDPGLSGAIAFYTASAPEHVDVYDIPLAGNEIDCAALAARIFQLRPNGAVIERVSARPGQGVTSMFRFGQAVGTIYGALGALRVPVLARPAPGVWKRHFRLSADKEEARALAIRLWPGCAERFNRKKDHGRAEAALLARWGAEAAVKAGMGEAA